MGRRGAGTALAAAVLGILSLGLGYQRWASCQAEGRSQARAITFRLVKVRGKAVYGQEGRDRCDFTGWLENVPAGFDPEGTVLDFHIGGAWIQVTLDSRGRNEADLDAGGAHKFRLAWNFEKDFPGGELYFTLRSGGTWQDSWTDEGITPDREAHQEEIEMAADLQVGSEPRSSITFFPELTSKPERAGTFILLGSR
jgi:hypothetical protein